MQAFAEDLLPIASNEAFTCPNNAVSNEKRMNLSTPFECLSTRH